MGVTPARLELDLTGRTYDFELTVFNDDEQPQAIEVSTSALGHELDGTPTLTDAISTLTVVKGPRSFVLQPGESVTLQVRASFPNQVGLYGAVIARVTPPDAGQAIDVRTQVASLLLLRGPRPWDQSLVVEGIGLVEGAGGQTLLYADIKNVGNAHVVAIGEMNLRRAGTLVDTLVLPEEIILPRYARRLTVPWDSSNGGGETIEIEVDLGDGSTTTETIDLSDIPPATAATPEASGGPETAVLERPDIGEEAQSVDSQRRVLLPLAAILILAALGSLWLMLLWKRRDEDEEDEDGESAEAATASTGATEDGS